MHIEEYENDPYKVNQEELLERNPFPYFSLYTDSVDNYSIKLSSGHELYLGKIHPAAAEYLLGTLKTLNKLAQDPAIFSYDQLKDIYGEYSQE